MILLGPAFFWLCYFLIMALFEDKEKLAKEKELYQSRRDIKLVGGYKYATIEQMNRHYDALIALNPDYAKSLHRF